MRSVWRALPWLALFSLVLHAGALVLAPTGGAWAGGFYARTIYPALAPVIGFLPNLVPFSVTLATGGLLLVVAAASFVAIGIALVRRRAWPLVKRLAAGWIVLLAILFHWFFVAWGYHYLRPPLATRAGWPPVEPEAVATLRRNAVDRVNAGHVPVPAWDAGDLDRLVSAAVDRTARDLGDLGLPVDHRIKPPLPPALLATIGTYGFISPWFLEAHVDLRLPPVMLAFTAAHEKAHLAGYAPESEANFIAWLALTTADDPRLRYAGHFGVLPYAITADTVARLSPGVRADLRAMRDYRRATVSERLERGARTAYKAYLRANRVEGGLASYAMVVRLIARYERSRSPVPPTRR